MPKEDLINKADAVREFLAATPKAKNTAVVEALAVNGIDVKETYVANVKARMKSTQKRRGKRRARVRNDGTTATGSKRSSSSKFPRDPLERALRIPRAIFDQNAGRECSIQKAAEFLGLGSARGPFAVEVSSGIKYGILERTGTGRIKPTDLARKVLRPQDPKDELEGIREAVLNAPDVSEVYKHYRGENLPDDKFFEHALEDTFQIPAQKVQEFRSVFMETVRYAQLIETHGDTIRLIDFSKGAEPAVESAQRIKELGESLSVNPDDVCFVMMPFAAPQGDYYTLIYDPAIRKAGMKPVRADSSIFGAGKIMDQIWSGIHAARVIVAELTTKNPNVFYELGLAHALKKPVVLVSSNEEDVPFDLKHIRVIYYDVNDPFWGKKLLDKVAENILSAIRNPEEAIFKGGETGRQ